MLSRSKGNCQSYVVGWCPMRGSTCGMRVKVALAGLQLHVLVITTRDMVATRCPASFKTPQKGEHAFISTPQLAARTGAHVTRYDPRTGKCVVFQTLLALGYSRNCSDWIRVTTRTSVKALVVTGPKPNAHAVLASNLRTLFDYRNHAALPTPSSARCAKERLKRIDSSWK